MGNLSPGDSAKTTAGRETDIRIEALEYGDEDYLYRTPVKFGGVALDPASLPGGPCTNGQGVPRLVRRLNCGMKFHCAHS